MAEPNDKYIKCSKCRCKYINDDDHIKVDFGYNRLNERFKTCVKCRSKSAESNKAYRQLHQAEISERIREYKKQLNKLYRNKQLNTEVDENHQCCTRCYKIQPKTEYGEYKHMVKIDGTIREAMVQYRSCTTCRNRDKQRRTCSFKSGSCDF